MVKGKIKAPTPPPQLDVEVLRGNCYVSRREGGLRLGVHAGSDLGELVPNETAGPADGPDAWEEKKVGTEAE